MRSKLLVIPLGLLVFAPGIQADDPPRVTGAPAQSVVEIQTTHDRNLIRDLADYLLKNPKAEDLDQAYMIVFEKTIEHDWFSERESLAKEYTTKFPDGPVRPMALIVMTMARAQAGQFAEALTIFRDLLKGLNRDDQEEFASNFSDSLASAAAAAGEFAVARQVYQALAAKYTDSPKLRDKIKDDLARLDMVGKPAPTVVVTDLAGKAFRLSELKGKYILIDFWATWCAPCIAELPNMQAAYAKFHDRGFEIVGVSLDETAAPVVDFVKARKIPWRQIHNATSGGDVVDSYGVNNIPATFLIAPDGTVARLELRGQALDRVLGQLIK